MIEFLPENIPEHYQSTAESIREYLVSVRGGAPFLSSTDGQILVEWLDASISPAIICTVIDKVALRRRKKRVKSRLTLNVCRGELNKMFKTEQRKSQKSTGSTQRVDQDTAFEQLKSKILAESLPVSVHSLRTQLIASIYDVYQVHLSNNDNFDLQDRKRRIEDQLQRTIKLLSDIHQKIYQETIDEHEELYFQAELELTSLRSILPPMQWRDAVDEVIRDKLRQRYPSLRVGVVWDMINQS